MTACRYRIEAATRKLLSDMYKWNFHIIVQLTTPKAVVRTPRDVFCKLWTRVVKTARFFNRLIVRKKTG